MCWGGGVKGVLHSCSTQGPLADMRSTKGYNNMPHGRKCSLHKYLQENRSLVVGRGLPKNYQPEHCHMSNDRILDECYDTQDTTPNSSKAQNPDNHHYNFITLICKKCDSG